MVDVRFKRLSVSIIINRLLSWYFVNTDKMSQATYYNELGEYWKDIKNLITGELIEAELFKEMLLQIVKMGGLIPYIKALYGS